MLAGAARVDQARQEIVAEVLQPVFAGLGAELVERVEQRDR
jgi:hypothetical protein